MFQPKLILNSRKTGEAPNITWPKILNSKDNCSKFTQNDHFCSSVVLDFPLKTLLLY